MWISKILVTEINTVMPIPAKKGHCYSEFSIDRNSYMKLLKFFFLLCPFFIFSQEFKIAGSAEAKAILATENENPFWFHTNTNFAVGELTNFSATGELRASLLFPSFLINGGAAVFGRDGVKDAVQRRDLYLQFENSWLFATVGAKKQFEVFNGLSATNQDFLWSGNARPLPGILLEANNPFKISKTFAVDWGMAHYELNDDRYVDGTHVHYKRLSLITSFNENNTLTAKVQHYVQWGGTSPEWGKLKSGFKDFVNVFFAHTTEEYGIEGETLNKLGNHLGSVLLDYNHANKLGSFSIYHDHYIEDGSGTRLANFPDGLWGIYFEPANNRFFTAILYEYIDTMDQSGISVGSGKDNYFSNSIYRSGWSYEKNIMGVPFILYDKSAQISEGVSPIISNRVKVHHFGLMGHFDAFQWKLKSSLAKYTGTYRTPLYPEWKYWYNYGSLSYKNEKLGTFTIMGGADFSNKAKTLVGGGVEYSYSF
ncbi:capsule assembly Wzi family protein [Aequorivita sp. SDUM287046]|uniref:Capsule assembly Wzi family protein n=1 Tax=Aequorivita aurantiaca TaxID=3053356 RepID=A0ABT8DJ19_9FLAO|nr:capsule assembly Wzi family protein [Aequorivita aurantiaca]MDN3723951.1 capsule assembly Wzi family protein [Aequorivita aurantiaca]